MITKIKYGVSWAFICLLVLQACETPYNPELEEVDVVPTLIVDGFIDLSGPSRFTITRSVPIYSGESTRPMAGGYTVPIQADVSVVSENGQHYAGVRQSSTGQFLVEHSELNPETAYFLRIVTEGGVYESTPSRAIQSGEIGDIEFRLKDEESLEILVSSHDPKHSTDYYRWEFEETWKFNSPVPSSALLVNGQLVDITPETNYGTCYLDNFSSNILIASTSSFNDNRIFQKPIQSISHTSEKLVSRYSILVKQYAISQESYSFWELIQRNSENIGDIFGVMPSEIGGNIRNLNDPTEKVVGLIEVLQPTEKRIYINNYDVPAHWMLAKEIPFYEGCRVVDTLTIGEAPAFFREFPGYLPGQYIFASQTSPLPTHITFAPARCVDCTLYGRQEKPDFWID